jgi:D-threonate/D-erythronate kinase
LDYRKESPLPDGWILAIADDLTGALETGAKFADCGLAVRVTVEVLVSAVPDVQVLVINTESRHLPAMEAARIIHEAAVSASRFSPWLIYKKTDSTLRGNIRPEFRALQEVFSDRALIYAPAYPEMGRTVKDGRLLLWGVPVHETTFAADLRNPVYESDIRVLLNDLAVHILDGESSVDVREAARLVMTCETPPVAAGPAALAEALAERIRSPEGKKHRWPSVSRCLVVNGSLHPASVGQIALARKSGFFSANWKHLDCDVRGAGSERAAETGERVRRLLDSSPVEALIVFGGDTTSGIHRALGAFAFEPYGEIVPGVPLSLCGGMFWITKAGGFGEPDILYQIRKRLT